jgi:F-type H+-transporting ATPase subunit delta
MADARVASRYVRSLLGLAVEQKALEAVHDDMLMFDRVCDSNRDFLVMMRSPVIKHELKRDILEKLFKQRVHPLTWAILDIITRKNRESLLPAIADSFHKAYNEHNGIGFASVISTVPLDAKLKAEIEKVAQQLSNRSKTELEEKVDPSLVGGFILNVGDKQIDASIASKLRVLKHNFSHNPYLKEI